MAELSAQQPFNPYLSAEVATDVVTDQEFDYFSSPKDARAHAAAEGNDPGVLLVYPSGTAQVPRLYPEDLRDRISTAFEMIGSRQDHPFVHSDAYGLTIGITRPLADDTRQPSLILPAYGRSCDIRVPISELRFDSMVPHLDLTRKPWSPYTERILTAAELRLGRNVLVDDNPEAAERAARDTYRPWEAVLAVGQSAVLTYALAVAAHKGIDYEAYKQAIRDKKVESQAAEASIRPGNVTRAVALLSAVATMEKAKEL